MTTSKTEYPGVVRLKSGLAGVAIGVGAVMLSVMVYNLLWGASPIHASSSDVTVVQKTATEADNQWAEQAKPVRTSPPTSTKNLSAANNTRASTSTPEELDAQKKIAEALQKAMQTPIGANELKGHLEESNVSNTPSDKTIPSSPITNPHEAFLASQQMKSDDVSPYTVRPLWSPYTLQAGTVISGILLKAVQSDLPDQITGQVQRNVYDTVTGHYLLIPQGAKLIGTYDSTIQYGQTRLQVVWKRVLFPNGESLDLGGISGDDVSGQSGFSGHVNNHEGRIFGAALLTSLLSAGAQLSQPQNTQNPFASPSVNQVLAQSLGTNIANAGTLVVTKNLNIPPRITIPAGYSFVIQVSKDIVFLHPYPYEASSAAGGITE